MVWSRHIRTPADRNTFTMRTQRRGLTGFVLVLQLLVCVGMVGFLAGCPRPRAAVTIYLKNDSTNWVITELIRANMDVEDIGGLMLATDVQPGRKRTLRLSEGEAAGVYGFQIEVTYIPSGASQGMGTILNDEFQFGDQYDATVTEDTNGVPGFNLVKR